MNAKYLSQTRKFTYAPIRDMQKLSC